MNLLYRCIATPSISGNEQPLAQLVADQASSWGFDVDLFETDEARLANDPAAMGRHLPLAGRPTVVVMLKGRLPGKTLMFNAHSDVVATGDENQWRHGPWSGSIDDGRMYGRGACDAKGPLVAGLGAMLKIRQTRGNDFAGTVALELIPGEEDCVDLGTLTSVVRGYRADAAIILEPTEGLPRCASRSGLRFEVSISGRAVHGTVKWLGIDAIRGLRHVLSALDEMENKFSQIEKDERYADYPVLRPITVDQVSGGDWQGMIADNALCAGYFELCPEDDLNVWQERFISELKDRLGAQGFPNGGIDIQFPERYRGFFAPTDASLCRAAEMVIRYLPAAERWKKWRGFNSGCEGGLRFAMHRTQTLVWGPGSLEQAHRIDEFVPVQEVLDCSGAMAAAALAYLDEEMGVTQSG
ncbi:MAG: M20 family metallopeptidase [Phycisphaerae bacterium]